MTRQELVTRAKAILAEAYDEAAEMIVLYLEKRPGEKLQSLCKEIDPDNWNALRVRVQRAQAARKASADADSGRTTSEPEWLKIDRRATKRILREAEPEQLREIMEDLPTERRAEIVRAAVPPPERITPRTGPTFIDLLVRVSGTLIELEAMVSSWQNPTAVPPEFSRESFNDIVAKVIRIQDHFDAIANARDDEDEFEKIVRNFRVSSDVR